MKVSTSARKHPGHWRAWLAVAVGLLVLWSLWRAERSGIGVRRVVAAVGVDRAAGGTLKRAAVAPFLGMIEDAAVQAKPRRYRVVNAFAGLLFQNPMQILPVPRSDRLCVIGREGTVETFVNRTDVLSKTMVLDIRDRCQGWDDSGLLGIAFHPEFGQAGSPNRGYFYIWYNHTDAPTAGPGRPSHTLPTRDRLMRYTIPDGQETADPASALLLIDQNDRDLYHNGGGMFFGGDGFLYISLGDEGFARDYYGNAQKLDGGLFAGMIRIDVDQDVRRSHPIPRQPRDGVTAHYMIPNDNPWAGRANTLEEFWCIGLRSPHRVTYDGPSGTIFCGENGQDLWEELELLKKGGNYQWAFGEGSGEGFKPQPAPGELVGTLERPLYEYPHAEDRSIIGGYVYRGRRFPELAGQYIFGDNASGRLWRMSGWETGKPTLVEIARVAGRSYAGLSGFGHDADGELYMCQLGARNGSIFHLEIEAVPDGPALPALLSRTGVFSDTAAMTPAAGLVPYDLNVPFWSDGAAKRRWIALPGREPFDQPGEGIGFSATDSFGFPVGTVFVKHFDLPLDETRPESSRRLETRLLMRGKGGGIYGATYRWRADGRDADRLDDEASEEIVVAGSELVAPLAGTNVGVDTTGTFREVERGCDIVSGGGGAAGAADALSLASVECAGDFDVRVRVESLDGNDERAAAGLMFRQSNEPGSAMFAVVLRPEAEGPRGRLVLQKRQADNTPVEETALGVVAGRRDVWLRLQRRDQFVFIAYGSNDGVNWRRLGAPTRSAYRLNGRLGVSAAGGGAAFRDLARLRRQMWYYPSSFDCLTCHTANAGMVLGVNARQLNREVSDTSTGATGNQLMSWWRGGMFAAEVRQEQVAAAPRLTPASDAQAPLQERVRSYLDVNCGYCHRPGAAGGYFDARLETPFEKQNLLTDQLRNHLGVQGARVVAGGDLRRSMLLRRMRSLNPAEKMPPLARNRVDVENARMLEEWITQLPPAPPPPPP